jgi:hypothetical protein
LVSGASIIRHSGQLPFQSLRPLEAGRLFGLKFWIRRNKLWLLFFLISQFLLVTDLFRHFFLLPMITRSVWYPIYRPIYSKYFYFFAVMVLDFTVERSDLWDNRLNLECFEIVKRIFFFLWHHFILHLKERKYRKYVIFKFCSKN